METLVNQFKSFLLELPSSRQGGKKGLSKVSVKNYLSDIRRFLDWLSQYQPQISSAVPQRLSSDHFQAYLDFLTHQDLPHSTISRHFSSLRRFATFIEIVYHQPPLIIPTITSPDSTPKPEPTSIQTSSPNLLSSFSQYLKDQQKSASTVRNYLSDIRHFLAWVDQHPDLKTLPSAQQLDSSLESDIVDQYSHYLELTNTPSSTSSRRLSSLNIFTQFATNQGLVTPKLKPETSSPRLKPIPALSWLKPKTSSRQGFNLNLPRFIQKPITRLTSSPVYRSYHQLPFTPYLHLALLVLFTSAFALFGFRQIIIQSERISAYPSTPNRPTRQLSFQGRLTDSSGTPIVTPINATFKLWDQETGGTEGTCSGGAGEDCLYSTTTCSVDPDQDGIFNILLGDGVCGSEIPADVFTENTAVWLEVEVATETLTPRQPIATVAYALNSETVSGIPVSASGSATVNTLFFMNSSGEIVLGEQNPSIVADSGNFTLQGEALTLSTTPFSEGDITIAPDGIGQVNFIGGTTTDDFIRVVNANLTTGSLISGYVGNNNNTGELLRLSSGSSETDRFVVTTGGQTTIDALAGGKSAFIVNQLNSGPIFTASASGTPKFTINNSGTITLANNTIITDDTNYTRFSRGIAVGSNETYYFNASGNINANNLTLSGTTTLNGLTYTWPSTQSTNYVLSTNGSGTLSWVDPAAAAAGSIYWLQSDGAVYPKNATVDLLVGGNSTSSAKFAINSTLGSLTLKDSSLNTLFSVSPSGLVSNVPSSFTSSGNVSFAYDLLLTNQTASSIKSNAPLTIEAGESFESNDLTLKTYNQGSVVIDSVLAELAGGLSVTDYATISSSLALGTSSAPAGTGHLSMSGNLNADGNLTVGGTTTLGGLTYTWPGSQTNNYVLSTNGSGTLSWVDPASAVASTIYWTQTAGALHPKNATVDLLVGSNASASAIFRVDATTGNLVSLAGAKWMPRSDSTSALNIANAAGTSFVTFDTTNQRVGIGTSSPTNSLHVSGTGFITSNLRVSNTLIGACGGNCISNTDSDGGSINLQNTGADSFTFTSAPSTSADNVFIFNAGPAASTQNLLQLRRSGSAVITVDNSGLLGIGTTSPSEKLDVAGNATVSGNLTFTGSASTIANRLMQPLTIGDSQTGDLQFYSSSNTLSSTGNLTLAGNINLTSGDLQTGGTTRLTNAGNLTNIGTTQFNSLTYTWPGSHQSSGYVLSNNGSGTLSWVDPASAASGAIYWLQSNGALFPKNATVDLLVGGSATTSAKFAVLNMSSGTPTASISGTTSNVATYLTGEGNLATTNRANLSLAGTTTGQVNILDRTGSAFTTFDTLNGRVGIGTSSPAHKLQVSGGYIQADDGFGLKFVSTTDVGYFYKSNNIEIITARTKDIKLMTGGATATTKLIVKDSGNVGIGTTSPTSRLHVVTSNTSTTGKAVAIFNQLESQDILTASASSTPRLTILNNGNLQFHQASSITTTTGVLTLAPDSASNIQFYSSSNTLTSTGNLTLAGNINLTSGDLQTGGTTRLTNAGNLTNIGTTQFNGLTYTWPASHNSSGYILSNNGSGTLTWIDPATAAAGSIYWLQSDGAVYPKNATVDLLVGGNSTASAIFAIDSTLGSLTLKDSSLNTLFSVSPSGLVSNVPSSFTSSGNVSFAYDLLLTNQTASSIKSNAPLTIEAGESFESNHLTLKTYNQGNILLDSVLTQLSGGLSVSSYATVSSSLALGNTNASAGPGHLNMTGNLTMGGNLNLTSGALQTNSTTRLTNAGNLTNIGTTQFNGLTYTWPGSQTSNYVLSTNGSGTLSWVDPAAAVASTIYWTQSGGALYPKNATVDLLIGSNASSSAIFRVDTSTGNLISVAGSKWMPRSDSTTALNIANTAGTSFVTFDTTNQRVGIGTTSPQTKLHVSGEIRAPKINKVIVVDGTTYPQTCAGINAAIDALGSAGGEIYLPEGTYTCNETITIDNGNTTVRGAGWGTIIDASSSDAQVISGASSKNYITIRDLKIVGNPSSTNPNMDGIVLSGESHTFDHIWITNTKRHAIRGSLTNTLITNSFIENTGGWGIAPTLNTRITNNRFNNNTYSIVFYSTTGATGTIITNNTFGTDTTDNILTYSAAGFYYSNIIISSNTFNDGVSLAKLDGNVSISNNTFNNGNLSLSTTAEYNPTVSIASNSFKNASYLSINALSNTAITGNSFSGTSGYGIYINGDTDNVIVANNVIRDRTTGISIASALVDNTTIENNKIFGATTNIANTGTNTQVIRSENGKLAIGNITPSQFFDVNNQFVVTSSGLTGIGTTSPGEKLDISGNLKLSGTTTLNSLTYTWPSSQSSNYVLSTNGSGTLSWSDPTALAASTIYWTQANGTVYPKNTTVDLLVGGNSTASAKFAFLNVNSGTPTASISGTTANVAAYLTGNGNLGVTNMAPLILGGASTGSVQLSPKGTTGLFVTGNGRVGIGTTNPTETLHVDGNIRVGQDSVLVMNGGTTYISHNGNTWLRPYYNGGYNTAIYTGYDGTTPKVVITAAGNLGIGATSPISRLHVVTSDTSTTGKSVAIFDQLEAQDIFTASSSGTPKFTINNSGNISLLGGVAHSLTDNSGNLTLTSNSSTISLNDNVTFAGTTTLNSLTYTWPSSHASSGYVLSNNGSGSLTWIDPAAAAAGSIYWLQSGGAVYPKNATVDLLVGGNSTSSAKFAVLNMNTGTPTASISGTTANVAAYLTGEGNLQTTNRANLNLAGATTGQVNILDRTGFAFTTFDTLNGRVGIGTSSPVSNFDIRGKFLIRNSTDVSSSTTLAENYQQLIHAGVSTTDLEVGIAFHSSSSSNDQTPGAAITTKRSGTYGTGHLIFKTKESPSAMGPTIERMRITDNGNLGINTTSPSEKLDVAGNATVSGNLTFIGSASTIANRLMQPLTIGDSQTGNLQFFSSSNTLSSSGNLTLAGNINLTSGDLQTGGTTRLTNAGNLTNIGTTQFNGLTYTWPSSQSSNYVLSTNGSGTLSWVDPASAASGAIYWLQTNGALYPKNATVDLLVGGNSTSSAKFAFINVNSGTPTASISGNLSLAVPTGSAPATKLNIYNGGTFGLRTSTGGDAGLTERLTVLNNGNVGIGTTNPTQKLDVAGGIALSADISYPGAGAKGIWHQNNYGTVIQGNGANADIFLVRSNGDTGLLIDNSGNVGIGTNSTPTSRLDITGSASLSGTLAFRGTTDPKIDILNGENFGIRTSSAGQGDAGLTEKLTLTNTGTVGISTTNPSPFAKLDIYGGGFKLDSTGGTANSQIEILNGAGAKFLMQNYGTNTAMGAAGNLYIKSGVTGVIGASIGGIDAMMIQSNGGVVIGTGTAPSGSGNLLISGTTTLNGLTYTWPSSQSSNYVLSTNGSGTLSWSDPTALAASTIYWTQANGAVYPKNATVDLLVGGNSTASAKFAFLGVSSGTPTASISGTTANVAAYLTGNGNLGVTNMAPLILGGASTGSVQLSPKSTTGLFVTGNGRVGIGTTNPTETLHVDGNIRVGQDSVLVMNGATTYISHNGNAWLRPYYNGGYNTAIYTGYDGTTPKVVITDIGNVGIGTTSPTSPLHIYAQYGNNAGAVIDQRYSGDILTASTSGTPKFTLNNSGNISLLGGVAHSLADSSGDLTLTSNSSTISLNDNVTFAGTTTLNSLTYTWPSSQSSNYVLSTNGSGTLSWVDAAGAASGAIYWTQTNGTVYPKNATVDLLVGGNSTASAKFAFLNVNSGTPTASISGTTANLATYLTGNGNLQTTNRTDLNLAGTTTGNLNILNRTGSAFTTFDTLNGRVGIGTTNPQTKLHVIGEIRAPEINKVIIIDGTTYASTCAGINAAIDALGSAGGEIYLPEGTYACDQTITIDNSNTTIRGSGWGTIIDASSSNAQVISGASSKNYITIRDLKIVGNPSSTNPNMDGIVLSGSNHTFDHIWITNTKRHAIRGSLTDSLITNSFIENTGGWGIAPTLNTRITNNRFNNNSYSIVFYSTTGATGTVIANNTFGTDITDNILTYSATGFYYSNIIISSNTFNDSVSLAKLDGNVSISNNTFNNGNLALATTTEYYPTISITGNSFKNASYLHISALSNTTIIGNSFSGTSSYGIYVTGDTDNVIVANNVIRDRTTGISIATALVDNATIENNKIFGATTNIADSGTNTQVIRSENGKLAVGNVTPSQFFDVNNQFVVTNIGLTGIGTTSPSEKLAVTGNATISGNLTFTGSSSTIANRLMQPLTLGDSQTGNLQFFSSSNTLSSSGNLTLAGNLNLTSGDLQTGGTSRLTNAGNLTNIGTTQFNGLTYTWPSSQSSNYVLSTNGSGTLSWVDPASAASGAIYWLQSDGAVYPKNATVDLLVGGNSTASAKFAINSTLGSLTLKDSSLNTLFSVSPSGLVSNVPSSFTSSGDVSFAYDLLLTNQTSSSITSNAPLTIEAGESFESNHLTLKTYNQGNILLDSVLTQLSGGLSVSSYATISSSLALGTSSAPAGTGHLSMSGNLSADGDLTVGGTTTLGGQTYTWPSSQSSNYVLSTNGSGTLSWVDPAAAVASTIYWSQTAGALHPKNATVDLLVGGNASASAIFRVDATTGNLVSLAGSKWMPRSDSTTALNIANAAGTSFVTFDTTNQRVGIGTSSPSAPLHVDSGTWESIFSDGTIDLKHSNGNTYGKIGNMGGTYGLQSYVSYPLVFRTNNLERVRIDWTNGNVGIGTTSPSEKLDVAGNATVSGNLTFTGSASTIANRLMQPLTIGDSQTGNLQFYSSSNRLTSSGNLTLAGNLNLTSGDLQTGGTSRLTNAGNLTNIGTTQFNGLTYTWPSTQSSNYVLTTNGSGTLTWSDPTALAASTIYWNQANGTVYPKNATVDLLVGGNSTASAKFAFINVNSGTPTASISGNLSLAVPTGSAPATKLNIYNGGTFGIRTSPGSDAGLTERLTVLNNGNVGIGTSSPNQKLVVAGDLAAGDTSNPITINAWPGYTSWINMPTVSGKASGIGSGGAGINPWVAYAGASGQWFSNAMEGDIAYRNTGGKLLFGNTTGNAAVAITNNNLGIGTISPLSRLHVATNTTSTAGKSVAIFDQLEAQDIFTASASGTPKFTINNSGNISLLGGVAHSISDSSGDLQFTSNSSTISLNDSVTFAGTTTLNGLTYTWPSAQAASQILQTNGSGTLSWVPPSSLSVGDADTLDGLDSLQFLRSDTSDEFTSGILSINSAADFDVNGDLIVSDTDITLDGASTNLTATGNFSVNTDDLFIEKATGEVGIGTITPSEKLDISGNLKLSGTTTFNNLTYTWPSSQSSNYVLSTNGSGTLSWVDAAGAASGAIYWTQANGTVYPKNATVDLLVGGNSTASAKFAFLNVNSGTPTASISGTTANVATYLTGNGNLGVTNMAPLTLGGSTTGSISLVNSTAITGNLTTSGNTDIEGTLTSGTSNAFQVDTTGNLLSTGTTGLTLSGNEADLTFSGTGNHDLTASAGTLRLGAATLTGNITGNSQSLTGLSQLTVDNLRLDGNTLDTLSGNLTLDSTTGQVDVNDNLNITGSLTVGTTTKFNNLTYTWPSSQSSNYVLSTNGSGTLSWVDPASAASGAIYWTQANGTVYPKNATVDLLVGGNSTASAKFAINSTLGSLTLKDSSLNTLFSVSPSGLVSNVPSSFTSSGDVSFAYDLLLTNQTSSSITSNAPLTIEAGESFESNDLTLKTYNQGSLVIDSILAELSGGLSVTDYATISSSLALGNTNAAAGPGHLNMTGNLTMGGNLNLTSGALQTNSTTRLTNTGNLTNIGTTQFNGLTYTWPSSQSSNYVLSTNGSGTLSWVDAAGAASGAIYWTQANGTVYPKNATVDLLVGGNASASAIFRVDATTGNLVSLSGAKWMPRSDSTSALNIANAAGTSFVTFDSTNQRVGIGMSGPVHKLDVAGRIRGKENLYINSADDNSTFTITVPNFSNNFVTFNTDDHNGFYFQNNGSTKLATFVRGAFINNYDITNSGLSVTAAETSYPVVKITGTTSQTQSLIELKDNAANVLASFKPLNAGNQRQQLLLYNTLETTPTNYERLAIYPDSTNNIFRIDTQNAGSGTIRNISLQTSTGSVGIGTISPTAKLDVSGNLAVSTHATISGSLALGTSSAIGGVGHLNMSGNLTVAGTTTLNGLTYTWPSAHNSAGYVLSNNGSGTLTWIDAAGASASNIYWTQNNGALYPKNATVDLLVGGSASASAIFRVDATTGNLVSLSGAKWMPRSDSTSALNIANAAGTSFVTFDTTNQRVGIGTSAPAYKLDIAGDFRAGNTWYTSYNSESKLDWTGAGGPVFTSYLGFAIQMDNDNNDANESFRISTNGNQVDLLVINADGNVGIGDATPASLLTVGDNDLFQINSSGNIINLGGAAHSISNSSGNLTLDSAGSLILADTNIQLSGGSTTLDVYNNAADTNLTLSNSSATYRANFSLEGQLQLGNFTSNPTSIGEGSLIYRSDAGQKVPYYWNGANWTQLATGAGGNLWTSTDTLIYPTSYLVSDLAIGGNSTASAKFFVDHSTGAIKIADSAGTDFHTITNDNNNLKITAGSSGSKVIIQPDLQINGGDILGSSGSTRVSLVDALSLTSISGFLAVDRAATISATIASDMPLHLKGASGQTANYLAITSNGGSTGDVLTVLNNGNVGIGDTTPNSLLTVGNNDLFQINSSGNIISLGGVAHSLDNNGGNLRLTSNSNTIELNDNVTFAGTTTLNGLTYTWPSSQTTNYVLSTNGSGTLSWINPTSFGSSHWSLTNGALYPNNATADLLIGGDSTASAKFAFIVANTGSNSPTASVSGNLALTVPTGSAPAATLNILNGGDFNLRTSVGGDAELTSRLYISNDGNFGFNDDSPATFMEITKGGDWYTTLHRSGASAGAYYWGIRFSESSDFERFKIRVNSGQSDRLEVFNASNVGVYLTNGGTSWTGTSDLRLKENVNPVTNILNKLQSITTYTFNLKDNPRSDLGLIAQELYPLFPEVVDTTNEYWGINYDRLGAIALGGLKEQYQLFQDLRLQNDTLTQKLNQLSTNFATQDLNLTEFGDLNLATTTTPPNTTQYSLSNSLNQAITRLGAFSKAIIADLTVGRLSSQELISPLVEADQVITNTLTTTLIKPQPDSDLILSLNNQSATTPAQLLITDSQDHTIASLDSAGNATLSGELTATSAKFDSLEVGSLKANQIEGLTDTLSQIKSASEAARLFLDRLTAKHSAQDESLNVTAQQLVSTSSSQLLSTLANNFSLDSDGTHLALTGLSSDYAYFSDYLAVEGTLMTNDLYVDNNLITSSISSPLDDNDQTLYLQPTGTGAINLLAGLLVLDESGTVSLNGNLIVTGTLESGPATISGTLNLRASSLDGNQEATPSGFGRLLSIYNEQGEQVAGINASGSAQFNDLTTRRLIIAAPQDSTPSANQVSTTSNTTIGTATIPAGELTTYIENNHITDTTLIYLTPISDTHNQVLYVKNKYSCPVDAPLSCQPFFTVAINQPTTQDIRFNYWLIQVQ